MRDENHVSPILAYNETTGEAETIKIHPDTEGISCILISETVGDPTEIVGLQRDQNHATVVGAYNETSEEVEPLRCDTDGNLVITIA